MGSPKDGPVPHIEVADPAAAFQKLEDATRRFLAVPKKQANKANGKHDQKQKGDRR